MVDYNNYILPGIAITAAIIGYVIWRIVQHDREMDKKFMQTYGDLSNEKQEVDDLKSIMGKLTRAVTQKTDSVFLEGEEFVKKRIAQSEELEKLHNDVLETIEVGKLCLKKIEAANMKVQTSLEVIERIKQEQNIYKGKGTEG